MEGMGGKWAEKNRGRQMKNPQPASSPGLFADANSGITGTSAFAAKKATGIKREASPKGSPSTQLKFIGANPNLNNNNYMRQPTRNRSFSPGGGRGGPSDDPMITSRSSEEQLQHARKKSTGSENAASILSLVQERDSFNAEDRRAYEKASKEYLAVVNKNKKHHRHYQGGIGDLSNKNSNMLSALHSQTPADLESNCKEQLSPVRRPGSGGTIPLATTITSVTNEHLPPIHKKSSASVPPQSVSKSESPQTFKKTYTPPPVSTFLSQHSEMVEKEGDDASVVSGGKNGSKSPLTDPRVHSKLGFVSEPEGDETDGYLTAPGEGEGGVTSRKRGRIRVVVRKRPLPKEELQEGEEDCVEIKAPSVYLQATKQRVDLTQYTESHDYTFDDSFGEDGSNEIVFTRTCNPLIDCVFEGGSASCFAYGQTGSGKTHTMIGNDTEPGMYILAAQAMFDRLQPSHRVFVSLYEIYCNSLFDLLNHRAVVVTREDANKRVNVCGLTWHEITSVRDLVRVIDKGTVQRRTGSTSANEFSSRSHAVLTITLRDEMAPRFLGSLNVVDLAGSERAADTADNGKQTRLEGAEINKSLLALKECIRGLDERKKHIPFRGSKLTEVLRDSFVGNSRTVMIATIMAGSSNVEHTLNTLRYAFRVKGLSVENTQPSKERNAPRPRKVALPADMLLAYGMTPGGAGEGMSLEEAQLYAEEKKKKKVKEKERKEKRSRDKRRSSSTGSAVQRQFNFTPASARLKLPELNAEDIAKVVETKIALQFESRFDELKSAMEQKDSTIMDLLSQNQKLIKQNEDMRRMMTYHDATVE